ncbi:MAG: Rrf2 family transcriptional regulator [candidate division WOR-3 bacterium]
MSNLVKISESTFAAIHSVVYLAKEKRVVKIGELSEKIGSTIPVLSKVLQYLAKRGLIDSTRGPQGGFIFSKDPSKITLLDIFQTMEGPLDKNICPFNKKKCHFKKCIFDNVVKKVNQEFLEYLENTTVDDLTKKI